MTIYHVARRLDWDAAQASGQYTISSRESTLEQEGFIHCSTPAQVHRVAERVWKGTDSELVVLEMDEDAIATAGGEVRFEGSSTELYPHIYGAILPLYVTAVLPARFDDSGAFSF